MTNSVESASSTSSSAAYFVGITGSMNLVPDEIPAIQHRLRALFQFLRSGPHGPWLNEIVSDLVPPGRNRLRGMYRAALSNWTGLGPETPIVVLTNLAPGVDTLAANLVLDEFQPQNFHVRCPLPFPPELYLGATTFVRSRDGLEDPGNRERQQGFLRVLEKMKVIPAGLSDRVDGRVDLPDDVSAALKSVPHELLFPVYLKQDRELAPEARQANWKSDRADSDRRELRYYAAGEYLAMTTHLLVAVCDAARKPGGCGSAAVVEARLAGPRIDLLPTTSKMAMPHGAPVWHLVTRPGNATETSGATAESLPSVRILHPYMLTSGEDPQSPVFAAHQPTDAALQADRLRLFARIGENLKAFHTQPVAKTADRGQAYAELMNAGQTGDQPPFDAALNEQAPEYSARLRRVSDDYSRATELADTLQPMVKGTLIFLFWITFEAAILLDCFSHWHPRSGGAEHADHPQSAAAHQESHPADHISAIQLACGWLGLALGAAAVGVFACQRSRKLEERGHDARAIAEGLRVQFYWNLAGLGKSVSANYMSRHRSELDWIRGAIRATSIPYERWDDQFQKLSAPLKLLALRAVQNAWIAGQLRYFRHTFHRRHHELHLWHKLGGVAAMAGVLTFLKLLAHHSAIHIDQAVDWLYRWTPLLVIAVGVASFVLARRKARTPGASAHGQIFPELQKGLKVAWSGLRTKWPASWWSRLAQFPLWLQDRVLSLLRIGIEIVGVLVPTPDDSATNRTHFLNRLCWGSVSFWVHVPLALAVAGLAGVTCEQIVARFSSSPSALHLGIISGGVLLLAGALSVAWAEKNLHSELAYQFNTMAGLFHAADIRLNRELADLESAIHAGDDDATQAAVGQIQALLFELGKEALEENAEWLLLHRSRPLEPVMAG